MGFELRDIIPVLYSGLYFLLAGGVIALAVLAIHEEVPAYARDPPCFLPLRKMAVFLYRKLLEYRERRRRRGKDFPIPGEEGVRNDFSVLYPSIKARRCEIAYRIAKTEKLLLLFIAGIVLAGALHFQSLGSGIVQDDGTIERAPAGGSDRRVSVTALPAPVPESAPAPESAPQEEAENAKAEKKKDFGTYTVTIHARRLTRPEAEKQAENILKRFPDSLLGENADTDDIRKPLKMPAAEELFPFVADWESSRYAVLDTDGSIFNSEYADDRAERADLTLVLTYGDWRFEKKMSFTVRAPVRDEETRFRGEIENTLKKAEKESSEENIFSLPSKADGIALVWKEQIEDISTGILFMGMLICVCAWYMMDRRLHEQTVERSRQLAIDYPQLISRIVLYLGAGMSVRNVFYKCASEYRGQQEAEGKRKAGKKKNIRYHYEEILLVCNELDSGVAEAEAYMHFGRRCHSRQYTKLCSLLVQNLRRGNDTLLAVLQEEAQSSFEERKNLARELGEEAGTKLLLPMMIMLGVTMLIIIVPAYFSFSM